VSRLNPFHIFRFSVAVIGCVVFTYFMTFTEYFLLATIGWIASGILGMDAIKEIRKKR